MKKYLSTLLVLLFVCSLNAEVNSSDKIDVKKEVVFIGDVCTVQVSADCDGDGLYELTAIVDCENADAMADFFYGIL